jgi:hypothetical protein
MSKTNYDVAHEFAYGSTDAKTANMFIVGDCIYSYGYHFCIAKRVGRGHLLFTTRSYSNTTAKHISYVRQATSHYDRIYCAYPNGTHNDNQKAFLDEIKSYLPKLAKARKPDKWIYQIQIICAMAKKYCEFFEIKMDKDLAMFVESDDLNKTNEKYLSELKKREERLRREKMRANKEALKKWHNFETSYCPSLSHQELRVNAETNRIETTMRVVIPFELGRAFYAKLKANELKEGDNLMHYRIRKITDKEISIGCHTFKRKYLLDFGKSVFCE